MLIFEQVSRQSMRCMAFTSLMCRVSTRPHQLGDPSIKGRTSMPLFELRQHEMLRAYFPNCTVSKRNGIGFDAYAGAHAPLTLTFLFMATP